jgi:hypothetical protein
MGQVKSVFILLIYSLKLTYHHENIWRGTMPLVEGFQFKFIVLTKTDDGKVVFEKWEKDPNRTFNYTEVKNALDSHNFRLNEMDINVENEVLKLKCSWKD